MAGAQTSASIVHRIAPGTRIGEGHSRRRLTSVGSTAAWARLVAAVGSNPLPSSFLASPRIAPAFGYGGIGRTTIRDCSSGDTTSGTLVANVGLAFSLTPLDFGEHRD